MQALSVPIPTGECAAALDAGLGHHRTAEEAVRLSPALKFAIPLNDMQEWRLEHIGRDTARQTVHDGSLVCECRTWGGSGGLLAITDGCGSERDDDSLCDDQIMLRRRKPARTGSKKQRL